MKEAKGTGSGDPPVLEPLEQLPHFELEPLVGSKLVDIERFEHDVAALIGVADGVVNREQRAVLVRALIALVLYWAAAGRR